MYYVCCIEKVLYTEPPHLAGSIKSLDLHFLEMKNEEHAYKIADFLSEFKNIQNIEIREEIPKIYKYNLDFLKNGDKNE